MPRILPRLLKALQNVPPTSTLGAEPIDRPVWRKKTASLWREPPPVPDWVGRGRTQSVLADDINPFTNRRRFRTHKTLPPRVQIRPAQQPENGGHDKVRSMTDQEREWYSSPYLRMLGTPMRNCILTGQLLPRDFLIRMAPMQIPGPRGSPQKQYLLPTGIEHPKYRSHRATRGVYMVCRKDAVKRLSEQPGSYKHFGRNITLHSRLSNQIGHLLRLRVIQEIELLAARLRCRPYKFDEQPILRRLTRAELRHIHDTGIIHYPSAVALLIVPPLNKDFITKARPIPNKTSFPDPEETNSIPTKSLPPLSQLHPASADVLGNVRVDRALEFPPSKIPFYNGITLFPSRSQRAALHSTFNGLLDAERRARRRLCGQPVTKDGRGKCHISSDSSIERVRGGQKASHAYLLCSDAGTLLRADAIPLTVALWRVRMWEGGGWEGTAPTLSGWKIDECR